MTVAVKVSAMRKAILALVTLGAISSGAIVSGPALAGDRPYQPDAWIKLCGQSLGCTIDPLPHPWRGKDVYNTTGRRQTEVDDINEGEGIRYWITIQNDGTERDTYSVDGCRGTPTFEVNRVLLGKHKRQDPGAQDLTRRYKAGTLEFTLEPGAKKVFTLNVITHTNKGVTYECRTVFTSQNDDRRKDVVVARMTTF
jgi:hypothetical protein